MKLKIKKYIKSLFEAFGYKIRRKGIIDTTIEDIIIKLLLYKKKDFLYLQIGANDGVMSDPIHNLVWKYNWKGIMVEPIPFYFNKLKKNRNNRKDNIFINKAIFSESNIKKAIFIPKSECINEDWEQGIASFNKEHLLKSLKEECIEQTYISTISIEDIVSKYDIQYLDLLLIDTEGYDYFIIKHFPFDKIKPTILQFEHGIKANIMNKEQLSELLCLLSQNGYFFVVTDYDVIAWIE